MKNTYKSVTRADVAKHAGVSETIVSYVINNNRYVDKDKKIRVEQAIKEMNYFPNSAARSLKGRNSNHIVFIADQIANEHFNQLISEMEIYAYDRGCLISLCANRNTDAFVSQIISRHYDGVIISSISFLEVYIQKFISARLPVVLLKNRDYNKVEGTGIIGTGLYTGAKECVTHLVQKGRKKILYIDRFSESGNFSTIDDYRYRGFVEQMQAFGLEVNEDNIITHCKNSKEVEMKIEKRINDGFKADALFGRNDRMACIGMKTVQKMGFNVPDDVAVIGFDNSSLSQYTSPTLTTVDIQRKEIGRAAIEMLLYMSESGNVPEPVEYNIEIVQREST